jgi:membrane protein involved in colicin uptake
MIMKRWIAGTGVAAILVAGTAMAQTMVPVPDAAAAKTAADAAAEAAAAKQKIAEQEKAAEAAREKAEDEAKAQKRAADKQREEAEKQAEKQAKAQQKAEAEAAAAAKKAEAAAAAEKAKAAEAAAATAAAAAAPKGDARDAAVDICMAEGKNRATTMGARDLTLREVKDTDKLSNGRVNVTAQVNVITADKNGKIKTAKKNMKCETRNGTITKFKIG